MKRIKYLLTFILVFCVFASLSTLRASAEDSFLYYIVDDNAKIIGYGYGLKSNGQNLVLCPDFGRQVVAVSMDETGFYLLTKVAYGADNCCFYSVDDAAGFTTVPCKSPKEKEIISIIYLDAEMNPQSVDARVTGEVRETGGCASVRLELLDSSIQTRVTGVSWIA